MSNREQNHSGPAPLSAYADRLLEVRREFLLFPDRIVVRACWWSGRSFEHVVRTADLTGEVRETVVRYRIHRYAGWLLAVGALIFAACFYYADIAWLQPIGYVALAAAAVGGIALALTHRNRRIRFARFPDRSGRIVLDIADAGNTDEDFSAFVRAVRRQCR